jgi:hypothetical protein
MAVPKLFRDAAGNVVPVLCPGTNEELDGGVASDASAVIDANHESIVRICAVDDIRVLFGTAPTAAPTSMAMPAGAVEYFDIPAGYKVAVLGGVATVTTMV